MLVIKLVYNQYRQHHCFHRMKVNFKVPKEPREDFQNHLLLHLIILLQFIRFSTMECNLFLVFHYFHCKLVFFYSRHLKHHFYHCIKVKLIQECNLHLVFHFIHCILVFCNQHPLLHCCHCKQAILMQLLKQTQLNYFSSKFHHYLP